jgi:methylmalonyl-CoA/ethylmalonyl-CoA epimerase
VPDRVLTHGCADRQFDHLGVIACDLAHGRSVLEGALGIRWWTVEFDDTVNDVLVQFGRGNDGMCFEIVAPRSPDSPVRNALRKRVNVLNHVAYRVADLGREAKRLEQAGFRALAEPRPAIAYGQRRIQFFVNADLFLLELIEAAHHRHRFYERASEFVS